MFNKRTKKLAAILLIAMMVATAITGCSDSSSSNGEEPKGETDGKIVIGVSAAITGPAPLDGERTVQGINLAVKEINESGGVLGKKFDTIVEDDQNTSNIAVNVVNKLVANNDIVAVLGPHRSANAMATEKIFSDANVPFITGASSPNLVTKVDNPYFFRIRGSDSFVGQIIAKFALEELGNTKIGIIYNNDDYGTAGKDVVANYLTDAGHSPVIIEGHNTGDMDMSGAITKCKDAGIDCLIVYTHDPEAAILTRQLNELGLDVPIVGPTTFSLPTYLSLVTAEETEGFFSIADYVADNPNEISKSFYKAFTEEYGVEPDLFAAAYYTATYALKDAIERAGVAERDAIQKALLATDKLPSVYGDLYANKNGELVHSAVVTEIVDNKPTYMTTVNE